MTEWDAAEYARRSSLQEAIAQEVLALLELSGTEQVLDVGCGDGKVTAQIAQRLPRGFVVGIDPSREMVQFAQAHFGTQPNLRFEIADARSLPFEDAFDLVVSFNALHWVPQQAAALRSIHSAQRINGKAQLRLVPEGPRKSLETIVEETRPLPRWRRFFQNFADPYLRLTAEEYAALAEGNGFRVLRLTTQDYAWNFESRAAFAAFSAVGCVAWTQRLPSKERTEFIDDVLDRYSEATSDGRAETNTFKFYQMDVTLLAL